MKNFLFDTNFLIDYLKDKPEATSLIDHCLKEGQILTCSFICKVELLSGARPGEEKVLQDFLDAFDRIGLNDNIAEAAGRYMSLYRKKPRHQYCRCDHCSFSPGKGSNSL